MGMGGSSTLRVSPGDLPAQLWEVPWLEEVVSRVGPYM